jgi:hypothetical protein
VRPSDQVDELRKLTGYASCEPHLPTKGKLSINSPGTRSFAGICDVALAEGAGRKSRLTPSVLVLAVSSDFVDLQ